MGTSVNKTTSRTSVETKTTTKTTTNANKVKRSPEERRNRIKDRLARNPNGANAGTLKERLDKLDGKLKNKPSDNAAQAADKSSPVKVDPKAGGTPQADKSSPTPGAPAANSPQTVIHKHITRIINRNSNNVINSGNTSNTINGSGSIVNWNGPVPPGGANINNGNGRQQVQNWGQPGSLNINNGNGTQQYQNFPQGRPQGNSDGRQYIGPNPGGFSQPPQQPVQPPQRFQPASPRGYNPQQTPPGQQPPQSPQQPFDPRRGPADWNTYPHRYSPHMQVPGGGYTPVVPGTRTPGGVNPWAPKPVTPPGGQQQQPPSQPGAQRPQSPAPGQPAQPSQPGGQQQPLTPEQRGERIGKIRNDIKGWRQQIADLRKDGVTADERTKMADLRAKIAKNRADIQNLKAQNPAQPGGPQQPPVPGTPQPPEGQPPSGQQAVPPKKQGKQLVKDLMSSPKSFDQWKQSIGEALSKLQSPQDKAAFISGVTMKLQKMLGIHNIPNS